MKFSFLTNGTGNSPNPNYVPPASKNNDFNISIDMARNNYQTYQNKLKKKSENIVKKWCMEIKEASSQGKKSICTNQFITDDDKDRILHLIDDSGCVCEFSSGYFLSDFQKYFEEKGFTIKKIEYLYNRCCLQIIWVQ